MAVAGKEIHHRGTEGTERGGEELL